MGTLLYALGPLSPTYYIVRRAIISLQRQLNSSEAHKVAPLLIPSTWNPEQNLKKTPQIQMAIYKILRNSAQKAKFPQVQKTPTRDPISGIFTCVPLL
jgi:hypothetical protein